MPPTRSQKANAQSKGKTKAKEKLASDTENGVAALSPTNADGGNQPPGDSSLSKRIKYTFERVRGDNLGAPLKEIYSKRAQPEFDKDTRFDDIELPQTSRPPPMSLNDLECIRTLGVSPNERVLLVSSHRSENRSQTGERALFAVKAVKRKAYRKVVSDLAAQSHGKALNVDDIGKVSRHHFRSQRERSALVDLPWNPFVAGLIQTFQDSQALYMAVEFMPGGTLRSLFRQSPGGLGQGAFFYFGNIVCALDFLRDQGITHRNLRPESILVGGDGYLSLSNFEEARTFDNRERDWTMVRREYAPPECRFDVQLPVTIVPEAIDWWSSGCILFEMITGEMAFFGEVVEPEPSERKEENYKPNWPGTVKFGEKVVDLVHSLLDADPVKRLGTESVSKVKEHPWFSVLDWTHLQRRAYLAPDMPKLIDRSQLWHDLPLPKQEYIPGLKALDPFLHLAHDNRFPERPVM